MNEESFESKVELLNRLNPKIMPETRKLIECYLMDKIASKRSSQTILTYIHDFNAIFGVIEKEINKIAPSDIYDWMNNYASRQKNNTINQRVTNLKRLINVLLNDDSDIITKSPLRKRMIPRKEVAITPRHLDHSDHIRVQLAAESLPLRERAIFLILDTGALRKTEVSNINVSDVDFVNCFIAVNGKGNKDAIVTVSKECIYVLSELKKTLPMGTDAFFLTKSGNRIKPSFVYHFTISLGKKADISGRLNPHKIRHTIGTEMLSSGEKIETIQIKLRHANPDVTKIYTYILEPDLILAYKKAMEYRMVL